MSSNEPENNIENILIKNLALYDSFKDYSVKDLMLKYVTDSGSYKDPLYSLFNQVLSSLSNPVVTNFYQFLDLLLVKNTVFLEKYLWWVKRIGELEAQVRQIKNSIELGSMPNIHKGMVIATATDDTEDKVVRNYGGTRWQRVMHFLQGASAESVGERGGESYTALMRKHLPDHRHELSVVGGVEVWKDPGTTTDSATKVLINESKEPGFIIGSKLVNPEIAPLGWTEDVIETNGVFSGGSRYPKPHNNIPIFKDVYFWRCEDPTTQHLDSDLEQPQPLSDAELATQVELVEERLAREYSKDSTTNQSTSIERLESYNWSAATSLIGAMSYDSCAIIVSDELEQTEMPRFKSKTATIQTLSDMLTKIVFNNNLGIHSRYLFKETYSYLISDIQDRIYLLLRSIKDLSLSSSVKRRAVRGQYIFIYNRVDREAGGDEDYIRSNYILPPQSSLVKVNDGVFLRGTSGFTQETVDELATYTNISEEDLSDIRSRTVGGENSVTISAVHVPKHLHFSALLDGIVSSSVSTTESAKGSNGTDLHKGDSRPSGIKYNTLSGTGNYTYKTLNEGVNNPTHNNLPQYKTLQIYQVV